MTIHLVPATAADEPMIREFQEEAIAWLATTGTGQWQLTSVRNPRRAADRALPHAIERGEVYIACDDGKPVGTLTLDDYADPEFWTEHDDPDSALYVHRMIVTRNAAGRDIGAAMLDWAVDRAAAAGKTWLRLDAWRTNLRLHDYYERHGFTHLRTIGLPWRGSGALFQRPATPRTLPN